MKKTYKLLKCEETNKVWGGPNDTDLSALREASFDTGLSVYRIQRHLDGHVEGLRKGSAPNKVHFSWIEVETE